MTPPIGPYEDFAEYDDRPAETVRKSFQKIDPITVIGSVMPSYYQWVQRLPAEIKEPHLASLLETLSGFDERQIRWAAERVRSNHVWPKYDQLGDAIAREAAAIRARSASRSLEQTTLPCTLCGDAAGKATGYVEAYLPFVVRRYQEGDLPRRYGGHLVEYTAVWRCPCVAGDATPQDRAGEYLLPLFDPARHVRVVERDLPIDVAIFHGEIEPIHVEIDWRRCKTIREAIAVYGPVFSAAKAERLRRLGLPTPQEKPNKKLLETVQRATQAVAVATPQTSPAASPPELDDVPF